MSRPYPVSVAQVLQELTERDIIAEFDMSQKVGAMIILQLREIKGSMTQLKGQMGSETRDNKKWRKKVDEWMDGTEARLSEIECRINVDDIEAVLDEVTDVLEDDCKEDKGDKDE